MDSKVSMLLAEAADNTDVFRQMVYPGRGIVYGLTEENFFQIYWLMGRSKKSRNRRLVDDGKGRVWTEFVIKEEEDDPLRLYTAMIEFKEDFIVSNGRQTDAIFEASLKPSSRGFEKALWNFFCENDPPIFTPRISMLLSFRPCHCVETSIICKDRRSTNVGMLKPGVGYCFHTYQGGPEDPPLPFNRINAYPILVPGKKDIQTMLDVFWGWLNKDNRVSLVVKFINISTHTSTVRIRNKY